MVEQQNELSLDLKLRGIERRVVWIDSDIDQDSLDIIRLILEWNMLDRDLDPNERQPIKLLFFSPGGDLDVNNALIDTITLSKTPIHGFNIGRCESAAAFIFLSCHRRFTLPSGKFLFHRGSGYIAGSHDEIVAHISDTRRQVEKMEEFMTARTNYSMEEVAGRIGGEWIICAQESIARGVAHEILSGLEELI